MKQKSLFFIFLISCPLYTITRESQVDTDWWGREHVSNRGEDLYNYVQNGCSHLLGRQFSKIDARERKHLYDSIKSSVHFHCGGSYCSQFAKACVDMRIQEAVINYIAHATEARLKNSTSDWSDAETVYQKTKQELQEAADRNRTSSESYELRKGFFEDELNDQTMVNRINRMRNQQSSYIPPYHGGPEAEFSQGFWGWIASLLYEEPAPQPPVSEWPPATNPHWHPEPSAPPAEPTYQQTRPQAPVHSADEKKLFPTQECSAGCMGDFKEDDLERIFLPCGHDACKDCAQNWFVTQNQNTCPQCRYRLSSAEKQNLKRSLTLPFGQCSCCNTKKNLRTLHCHHKICDSCTSSWVASENTQDFKRGCPRCGDDFRYR